MRSCYRNIRIFFGLQHLGKVGILLALSGGILSLTLSAQSVVTVNLTSPFNQTSFTVNRNSVILRGTAGSSRGIQFVKLFYRYNGTEITAQGTENWLFDNVLLLPGTNEVWISAFDFAGNKTVLSVFITYQPEQMPAKIVVTSPTAGQVIPVGTNPLVAWYIIGKPSPEWVQTGVVPDIVTDLYRNGVFISRISDIAIGVTNYSSITFNYAEGDGYQIRLSSYEGPNQTGKVFAFSQPFRIGPVSAPSISVFSVLAPNGSANSSATVKLGETFNFRWKVTGGPATQQSLNLGIGDVTGRESKIIKASQIGTFTYTLTASNSIGSDSKQVIVNVIADNLINATEILYNGITLNSNWPPKPADYPDTTQLPPYLNSIPPIIPINIGRQLFIDDFLIESSTLTRQFHQATMHPGNPVLKPNSTIEKTGEGPMAIPFSNGVFYDPDQRVFKMWYMCGYRVNVCYATSLDGVNWNKPILDVVQGTNIVFKDTNQVDTIANWLDLEESNPARRYKMLRVVYNDPAPTEHQLHYSSDGIHWSSAAVVNRSILYDRTSFFFNPFRKKWGLSLKDVQPGPIRLRRYAEHADLSFALNSIVPNNPSSAEMLLTQTSKWLKADSRDLSHPDDPSFVPNLYALEAAGYESLLLGQFSILRGKADSPFGRPKLNEVYFGFSRDGFHWHRPNRQAMFSANDAIGSWNWGNVQPVAGGPLIVGDYLYFYFSGRGGRLAGAENTNDSNGATGLATLRRDGFASLNAGTTEGNVITRKITFDGQYLFVNAEIANGGNLCVEILNENNQVIAPFTKENCQPFTGNATKQLITWRGVNDVSSLIGRVVKFRFTLKNGKLFSFWVSPTNDGTSRGYLGAGGPGYASYRDMMPLNPDGRMLSSVSAASYLPLAASQSIVATFGRNLSASTLLSAAMPLPIKLGETSVSVRDSKGVERLAPLFFVSPTQINYQVPSGTAEGVATVRVNDANNLMITGSLNVTSVAPGLFTASANGLGVPAAVALRVKSNGTRSFESIAQFDQATLRFLPRQLDLGPAGEQLFLILYGTGLRGRSATSNVTIRFADVNSEPIFVGASPDFVGLDQVNVLVPRSLLGRGNVTINLSVDGKPANPVQINIR